MRLARTSHEYCFGRMFRNFRPARRCNTDLTFTFKLTKLAPHSQLMVKQIVTQLKGCRNNTLIIVFIRATPLPPLCRQNLSEVFSQGVEQEIFDRHTLFARRTKFTSTLR